MNCKSIFKKVNKDMLALDTLPSLFRKAKQTKSFQGMIISMRRAFKEYLQTNTNIPNQNPTKVSSETEISKEKLHSLGESIKFLTNRISNSFNSI